MPSAALIRRLRPAAVTAGVLAGLLPAAIQAAPASAAPASAVFASAVFASAVPAAAAPGIPAGCLWTLRQLPLPIGLTGGFATKSDGADRIAGYANAADGTPRPVIWRGGRVTELPVPGGLPATAQDVNRSGVVVGDTQPADSYPQALVWRNGQATELAGLPGQTYAMANAISDAGLIVGWAMVSGHAHGVAWSALHPGRAYDLGVQDGDTYLNDVSDAGVVTGWTESSGENWGQRALAGPPGALRTPPGLAAGSNSTLQSADGPYLLGSGTLAAGGSGSLLWRANRPTALPSGFSGHGLNAAGVVVGSGEQGPAVVVGGVQQALPSPAGAGVFDAAPTDVSDSGVVIGGGTGGPLTWTCGATS